MSNVTTSIINQKGGVGKTVTALSLGAALAQAGKRVLLIDTDLQHSLTSHFDIDVRETGSLVDVLFDDRPLPDVIVPVRDNLSLVPSHPRMECADRELPHMRGGVLRLAHALIATFRADEAAENTRNGETNLEHPGR